VRNGLLFEVVLPLFRFLDQTPMKALIVLIGGRISITCIHLQNGRHSDGPYLEQNALWVLQVH
jgi:hypothetical protein